jgi:ribose transport system substrate-binding protein
MDVNELRNKLWDGKLTRRELMKHAGMLGIGAMAAQTIVGKVGASPEAIVQPAAEYKYKMAHTLFSFTKSSWEGRGVDTMKFIGDMIGVSVTAFDGQGSVDGERKATEDMCSQTWDFMTIHPVAADAFVEPLMAAVKRGIPLIDLDTKIAMDLTKVDIVSFLEPDNIFMGASVTKQLVDALGGKGEVVHTQGALTHTGAQGRAKGFHSVVDGMPGIKVVDETPGDWDPVKVRALWEDLLVKFPNIAGGMFHNDDMALAAYGAIKAAGKEKQIKIVGVDGMSPAIEAVMSGQMLSTVINPTGRIHGLGMWMGYWLASKKYKQADIPKYVLTDAPVVNLQTAPGFLFLANNLLI